MSVCQNPQANETLSFCEHGTSVKFGCGACQIKYYNLDKQETITIKKALWDEMLEYKKKVDELENNNIKLEKRITIDAQWVWKLFERIEKLEFDINNVSNSVSCVDQAYDEETDRLHARIEKLEQLEGERQQAFKSQIKIEDDFQKRIEKLEEKMKHIDNTLDSICG